MASRAFSTNLTEEELPGREHGLWNQGEASWLLYCWPSFPAQRGGHTRRRRPQAQAVQVYFSKTTRDIQGQSFPWTVPRTRPVSTCSLEATKGHGRRGSHTPGPLLPVFGKQTLQVDNSDLANTALTSPRDCHLLTHASDDKNATVDEMGVGERSFR